MSGIDLPKQLSFTGNGGTYPPHGIITADDHGPAVATMTWIMFNLMGLSVLARFATRRSLTGDNITIGVAAILATMQSITIHLATNKGLGRHRTSLDDPTWDAYSKAFYSSQILQIATICITKISCILVFMRMVSGKQMKRERRVLIFFLIFVALWGIAAIVALALQCQTPFPWNMSPERCYNEGRLYYVNGAINILTDIVIIAIPALIVFNIQIKKREQWAISLIFGLRILTCVATICQLVTLQDYLWNGDRTWFNVFTTIWAQVMMNLSIITANLPLTRPFLSMLQFSLIDSSTLPFSVPAGIYQSNYSSNRSPEWSKSDKSSKNRRRS